MDLGWETLILLLHRQPAKINALAHQTCKRCQSDLSKPSVMLWDVPADKRSQCVWFTETETGWASAPTT